MSNDFVHLHVHTEFSLLDGQSRIDKLVSRAKEMNQRALAITDHGVMFGVIDFYRACVKQGVKPIIGMEAYLARRTMYDRDSELDKKPYHLLLLAKNHIGYQNLIKLASEAQLNGFYYRPRVDHELLAKYSEGIICTSGCLGAEIPGLIMSGRDDEARDQIGWYQDVFGPENFYLELQDHDIPELPIVNKWLYDYRQSGHTPVGLVATNDVHYVLQSDHDAQDTLMCISTNALKADTNRMKMSDPSFHLASGDEMWRSFKDAPEALLNTVKIAEMVETWELDKKDYHLPIFPVPEGFTEASYLEFLCNLGMEWRYGDDKNRTELRERLRYELDIINRMGFATYFLIVWDLCQYARNADIWWNVRGSGAGSLVAYSTGITNIDPIHNGLFFERFLNPARISMPDIDLDYPDDRRGEMIAYAAKKYGEDKVAAIITFGTLGAKASVRDVGRVMDVELSKVNKAAALIPQEAKQKKIKEYIDGNAELKALYETDSDLRKVLDAAQDLQGISRHASTHAAGVIIADKSLDTYLPLHRITGKDPSGGALKAVTQFPMETAESIGLLKVDFLGLSTLTIMRKAVELIEKYRGVKYTMDTIPYRHDDPQLTDEQRSMLDEAFGLMGRGETIGVFQLESSGMQQMLRGMRPYRFEHIVAAVSLYRPGPMQFIPDYNKRLHGEEQPEYRHPKLESILEETFGIFVYQEQIMAVAGELFGYEPGEADTIRKAVSKKREKELAKHKDLFLQRGPENGIPAEVADLIFEDIMFFANYGFNKAHASDYAVIAVQTAFLKSQYPEEFLTALLTVQRDDSGKVATFLAECRRLHIPVLPPSINHSVVDFDIEEQPDGTRAIRFGLGAIKNAGSSSLTHIIEQRQAEGAFGSLEDFCYRVDMRIVGKRTLESLIKVGALDQFGTRRALLDSIERIISSSTSYHKDQEVGQMSLFGEMQGSTMSMIHLPDIREAPQRERLGWEKELLGLYVTGRPVDKYKEQFAVANLKVIHELLQTENGQPEMPVSIAGEIVGLRRITTRNGHLMVVMQLEDWHDTAGIIDVVAFPNTWKQIQNQLEEDEKTLVESDIIVVKGKLDTSRETPQIICTEIQTDFSILQADQQPLHFDNDKPTWSEDLPVSELPDDDLDDEPYSPDEEVTQNGSANDTEVPEPIISDDLPDSNTTSSVEKELPPWASHDTDIDLPPLTDEDVDLMDDSKIVSIRFFRTEDVDRDRRRLKRIHGLITKYPGHDTFDFVIVRPDNSEHIIEFPDNRTDICDALLDELGQIAGIEIITVDEE